MSRTLPRAPRRGCGRIRATTSIGFGSVKVRFVEGKTECLGAIHVEEAGDHDAVDRIAKADHRRNIGGR